VTDVGDREDDGFESGAGGEGSEGAGAAQSMPKLAEMRLLKHLQQDLLRRTKRFHGANPSEGLLESDLAELRRLGEEQAELRTLAMRSLGAKEASP
jgi:hypothetical protein